jgi:hypothetical protein
MQAEFPVCYIYADASNMGDRVSFLGVRYLAGIPGVELFASYAGLASTFAVLNTLQKKRPYTRILVGGGGLLQECFVQFWSRLLETSLPFAMFGVGANELGDKRNIPDHSLLEQLARRALGIHVRDQWTHDLLQPWHHREVSIGVCPAVNYLAPRFTTSGVTNRQYLFHVKHPVDITMAGGDPERLTLVLKNVAAQLNLVYDESDHIHEDLGLLVKRYQRARFVVSSRLHGCIFSYALGTPFVAVLADRKTAGFIDTHVSGNPTTDVHACQDEFLEKLLESEKMTQTSASGLATALAHNVEAMKKVMDSFK